LCLPVLPTFRSGGTHVDICRSRRAVPRRCRAERGEASFRQFGARGLTFPDLRARTRPSATAGTGPAGCRSSDEGDGSGGHRMGDSCRSLMSAALSSVASLAWKASSPRCSRQPAAAQPTPNRHGRLNGGIPGRGGSVVLSNPSKPIFGAEASATLRKQLLQELKAIASSDDAAVWAHRILGAKNRLTESDAGQVPRDRARRCRPLRLSRPR
jgi:hypothetical protein